MRLPPGSVILDAGEVDYVVGALAAYASALAPRSPSPKLLAMIDTLRRAGDLAESLAVGNPGADHTRPAETPARNASVRALQRNSGHAGPHDIGTAEAAQRLGITANGVRDLVRRGRLDVRRAGGRWLVDAASVDAHAQRRAARRKR